MNIKKIQVILIVLLMVCEIIAVPISIHGAQSVSENSVVEVETVEEEIVKSTVEKVQVDMATTKYSGTSGGLEWTIDSEGLLTISGTGNFERIMIDSSIDEYGPSWCAYRLDIKKAKVSVTGINDMYGMFSGCESMEMIDFTGTDTSQATLMSAMFEGCSSLNRLDLSNFNTSQVTNMTNMFYGCSSLTTLDLSSFDTSEVLDISGLFYGCSSLESVNLSSFTFSQVNNISVFFNGCSSLVKIVAAEVPSELEIEFPEDTSWVYSATGENITTITKAGTYVRSDVYVPVVNNNNTGTVQNTKPAPTGTQINSANLTGTGIPANSSFTVTSSDPSNPTVAFNGVSDENAAAVTIPATITYNGVTYRVTTVSIDDYTSKKDEAKYEVTSNKVGELTIEYKAPTNKKKKTAKIPEYNTYKGIKFRVTSVAAKAFKGNKKLKNVSIATSITKIGNDAFSGCKNLKTVTVGKSLETIGKNAFKSCKNLKKITIKSKKLKSVGKNAFKGVNKKCKIKVPKAKLKAYKKLFKKKGQAKTVKITK